MHDAAHLSHPLEPTLPTCSIGVRALKASLVGIRAAMPCYRYDASPCKPFALHSLGFMVVRPSAATAPQNKVAAMAWGTAGDTSMAHSAQGMHPGMLPPGAVPMPMTGEWTEGGMYYPFYYTDYS